MGSLSESSNVHLSYKNAFNDKNITILSALRQTSTFTGDANVALSSDAGPASHDERFKLLQSARKEAAIATYERAFKDKNARDELVHPHKFNEGQCVLVRHENP